MPRSRRPAASPAKMIPSLLRYLRTRGVDVDALIRRFGLPLDAESRTEVMLSVSDVEPLLAAASASLREPFLALHLPGKLTWPTYSPVQLAARSCATVGDVLARLVRYGSLLHANLIFSLEVRGNKVVFTHRVRGKPGHGGRHLNEYSLAAPLTNLRRLTGVNLCPTSVWFMHASPGNHEELERFFGTTDVDFDRLENALVFEKTTLEIPTSTGDPRLLATADELAERQMKEQVLPSDFAQAVAVQIRRALTARSLTATAVAKSLHMSARTMRRRLDEEGSTFRAVVDRVRSDLARQYARNEALPLAEVAYRLGFSELATFSRAFKRWTGQTPGAFRAG